jgi:hypothetical protein
MRRFQSGLTNYLGRWLETEGSSDDLDKLKDLLIREQLLESSSYNLQIWLRERNLKSVPAGVEQANQYLITHVNSGRQGNFSYQSRGKTSSSAGSSGTANGKVENQAAYIYKNSPVHCFKCGRLGHNSFECKPSDGGAKPKGKKGSES